MLITIHHTLFNSHRSYKSYIFANFTRGDDKKALCCSTFSVNGGIFFQVAISFDQTSPQEPQTAVTLRVKADPGSVVNILAVDRSVQLLASGNDITKQRVNILFPFFCFDLLSFETPLKGS